MPASGPRTTPTVPGPAGCGEPFDFGFDRIAAFATAGSGAGGIWTSQEYRVPDACMDGGKIV